MILPIPPKIVPDSRKQRRPPVSGHTECRAAAPCRMVNREPSLEQAKVTEWDPTRKFGWAMSADAKVFLHHSEFIDSEYKPLVGDIVNGKVKYLEGKRPRLLEVTCGKEVSESEGEKSGEKTELKQFTVGDSARGQLKAFNEEKGFGFLRCDGHEDVFVHASRVPKNLRKPGKLMTFDVIESKKKNGAIEAKIQAKIEHCVVGGGSKRKAADVELKPRGISKKAKPQGQTTGMSVEQIGTVMGKALQ
eukprot:gene5399-4657_t